MEVCKKPSEKQVGCICGDKQEATEPFVLLFNEKLCQGTISLGWKVWLADCSETEKNFTGIKQILILTISGNRNFASIFSRRLFSSDKTMMANFEPRAWKDKTYNKKKKSSSQVCNSAVKLSWRGPKQSVYICWPVIYFCFLTSYGCTSQKHHRHLTWGFCFSD